ncbi:MAG TPA: isochorismatase family protein [Myxococcota bacterium]|nr:isochorismatase family protein [Myxococcota bacterium]
MSEPKKAHPSVLDRDRSVLFLIDLQESYRGKLVNEPRVVASAAKLLDAAGLLGIPVIVTEQYPKGLGATRDELTSHLPANATRRFEKTTFSGLGAPGLHAHLRALARTQVVVAGIETHVCVSQTVHDLLANGLQAHIVRDAMSARFALEDETGFAKMLASGALPACLEGVLFEWLGDARAPEFKAAHRLVV